MAYFRPNAAVLSSLNVYENVRNQEAYSESDHGGGTGRQQRPDLFKQFRRVKWLLQNSGNVELKESGLAEAALRGGMS